MTLVHAVDARFSNDGRLLAVVHNKKVFVLKSDLSVTRHVLDGAWEEARVQFSPNNESLAIAKGAVGVAIHSLQDGSVVREIKINADSANCCCFSPDGAIIAVGGGGYPEGAGKSPGKVRVYETKSGKLLTELD